MAKILICISNFDIKQSVGLDKKVSINVSGILWNPKRSFVNCRLTELWSSLGCKIIVRLIGFYKLLSTLSNHPEYRGDALQSVLFVIFGIWQDFVGRHLGLYIHHKSVTLTAPTPSLPFLEQRWGQIRPDIQQADDYNWVPPDQIIMSHFIHRSSGFQYQPNNFLKAFPKSVTIKIAEQKRQAQVLTGRGGETVSSG